MLTVKLDPRLRAEIKALAAELGISTSELVRETLQQRIKERQSGRRETVYAATRDLCGVAEAPDPGLSARRMSVLLRERHARKRSR
jgi:hypothetical protein